MSSMGVEAPSMPGPEGTDENEQNWGCVEPLSSSSQPHLALSSLLETSSGFPTEGRKPGTGSQSAGAWRAEDPGAGQTPAWSPPTPPTPPCLCERAFKKPQLSSVVSAGSSRPQGP